MWKAYADVTNSATATENNVIATIFLGFILCSPDKAVLKVYNSDFPENHPRNTLIYPYFSRQKTEEEKPVFSGSL